MPTENYTSKFRVDVTDLKRGLQDANAAIKKATAEFKNATAGMDDWKKSAEGLTAKINEQQKKVEEERKKLELYKEQLDRLNKSQENGEKIIADLTDKYNKAAKEYGTTSEEAKKYAKQLSEAEAAQERNRKAAEKLELQIIDQDTAVKNVQSQIGKYEKALDDLETESKQSETANEKLDDSIEEVGKQAQKTTDGGLSAFTVALGNLAAKVIVDVTRKLGELVTSAIDTGKAFDSSMSNVKAISGATAEEIEELSDKAKELGATTKFTSTEVADGFGYMAMAGWEVEDQLNGINGVLALAAAANTDLATTSDIVTDALTAFGKKADQAGRLADIMAAASSNANTNIEMMGETFKYAAPLAGAMGYTMEDMAIATGLMANSGIKATQAGTSLRALMTRLAAPTKESETAMNALGISLTDDKGKMKSFMEVMTDLRGSFGELKIPQEEFERQMNNLNTALENGEISEEEFNKSQEQLIESAYGADGAMKAQYASMLAGKNGLSGFLAIVNASEDDFEKLTNAVYDSERAAQRMADTMIDNLGGDLTLLSSAFDNFKQTIYDSVSGPLREAVQTITGDVLPALTGLITGEEGAAEKLGGAVGGLLTGIIEKLAGMIPEAVKIGVSLISSLISGILEALPEAVTAIGNSVVILINALGELLPDIVDKILDILPGLGEALYSAIPQILDAFVNLLTTIVGRLPELIEKVLKTASKVWKTIGKAIERAIPQLLSSVKNLLTAITKALPQILETLTKELPNIIGTAFSLFNTLYPILIDALVQVIQALVEALPELITAFNEAAPDLLKAVGNAIVDNAPLLVDTAKEVWGILLGAIPPLLEGLWTMIKESALSALESYKELLSPVADWVYGHIIQPILDFIEPVTSFFSDMFSIIFELAEGCWNLIKGVWKVVSDWVGDHVVDPVIKKVKPLWDKLKTWASEAWSGIKEVFGKVADWFEEKFGGAWEKVKNVFSTGGKVFDGIKEGIVSAFNATVNALIRGINKVVAIPFENINNILDTLQNIEVLGISPFENLVTRINIPQIPELEYGGIMKRGQIGLLEGKGEEAVIPLERNTAGLRKIAGLLAAEMGAVPQSKSETINNYNFNQTNNSPKALSRWEIYRQTRNLVNAAKGV